MADYSQLPGELIDLFMQRLTNFEDCIKSGAVCKSWQSVAATCKTHKRFLGPLLMLTDDDTDAQDFRTFYCLSGKRDLTIKMPDIHGKTCRGTPYGWMVIFGLDFNTYLLNPFSRVWLSLPQVSKLPHNHIIQHEPAPLRFILSSNPSLTLDPHSEPSCIVIAMYTSLDCFALAKPGDKVWTDVDVPYKHYEDAIYLNGFLYAIADDGTLAVCDISAHPPNGTLIEASPPFDSGRADRIHTPHLVDISGELHLVVRIFEYFTDWFSIFKFGLQTKTWERTPCLLEPVVCLLSFQRVTTLTSNLMQSTIPMTCQPTTTLAGSSRGAVSLAWQSTTTQSRLVSLFIWAIKGILNLVDHFS